ncbi:MAG TPA: ATP-grasp domain-containing protein [Methyloradius sp.]
MLAADVFGDCETRDAAHDVLVLDYQHGGFVAADIHSRLLPAIESFAPDYFLYGSGFEVQPALLDEIAQHTLVLGNTADTVTAVKDPEVFFNACQASAISVPEIMRSPPEYLVDTWLVKQVGGSGGMHIKAYSNNTSLTSATYVYYQKKSPGIPVSCLFLANGQEIKTISFQSQLLAPSPAGFPYRYGGLSSGIQISSGLQRDMADAALKLTKWFGLVGLNSLDCLVEAETFQVLEINPRLSASFSLHAHGSDLLSMHMLASQRLDIDLIDFPNWDGAPKSVTQLVVYAEHNLVIPARFYWPPWAMDRPLAGFFVMVDTPLCTVQATAEDAIKSEELARQRAIILRNELNHYAAKRK